MQHRTNIEKIFEACLWKFRLFTILPVIFGLLSTLNFFVIGSFDVVRGITYNFDFSHDHTDRTNEAISRIITGVDNYLIGVVLLIFSFGIYELFISRIDIRLLHQDVKILQISSLDQLKHKILQVIVMVLVVSFFKKVLTMEVKSSLDMLYLAISILVIAISSYLMHAQSSNKHSELGL
ncbi:MAG: YqhA family protein [Microcoleaceae cyanobacterium]